MPLAAAAMKINDHRGCDAMATAAAATVTTAHPLPRRWRRANAAGKRKRSVSQGTSATRLHSAF